jgi:hypothetical protein
VTCHSYADSADTSVTWVPSMYNNTSCLIKLLSMIYGEGVLQNERTGPASDSIVMQCWNKNAENQSRVTQIHILLQHFSPTFHHDALFVPVLNSLVLSLSPVIIKQPNGEFVIFHISLEVSVGYYYLFLWFG